MKHKFWLCAVALTALAACSSPDDTATPATEVETQAPATQAVETPAADIQSADIVADKVEITLVDVLDGVTSSYCIDIAGGNKNIDISKGLQAHTCYSYRGAIGTDQTFTTSRFAKNELYMPDFDVCAAATSLTAGASIGLASCDGSDLQKVSFLGNGTISMAASPELCFTAAQESRFGKSKVHQIKALSLENCSSDLAAYQTWRGRASAD